MIAAPLRSRYQVVRSVDIQTGDILGAGRIRVRSVAVGAAGQVDLSLENGTTRQLPASTKVGVYR